MLRIEVPARIHIGLISLSEGGPRRNGGLGFSIAGLQTVVSVKPADIVEVDDLREYPLPERDLHKLKLLVTHALGEVSATSGARVVVESESIAAHVGLGSGTAIALAAVEGAVLANGITLDRPELLRLSGRGGASGVGVNTYFDGGYVLDLGHRTRAGAFLSSDSLRASESPLVGWSCTLPNWEFGLCIPNLAALSIQEEEDLFRRICPLPLQDSALAAYYALFGVHAALLEKDYEAFSRGINLMQETAWKRAEWDLRGGELVSVRDALLASGATAVGLSSLGPSLYFLSANVGGTVKTAIQRLPDATILSIRPSMQGRAIVRD